MQQRPTEIAISHLHPIIQTPKRSPKAITDARESTTTRRIGLEHQEWFACGERDGGGIEVRGDERFGGGVVEEVGEFGLRVFGRAEAYGGTAVVVGVANER